jgi:ribonuclease HII
MTPSRAKSSPSLYDAERFLLSTLQSAERLTKRPQKDCAFVAVDEVGRGCIAGPLVVCATLWSTGTPAPKFESWLKSLKDSKKMSPKQREHAVEELAKFFDTQGLLSSAIDSLGLNMTPRLASTLPLTHPQQKFLWKAKDLTARLSQGRPTFKPQPSFLLRAIALGAASAQDVDSHGIVGALNMAAARALKSLKDAGPINALFFDGHQPLSVPSDWTEIPQILVTKGDDLLKVISASSVIAKVIRDRWMDHYSEEFPGFFFDEHRGYGTEKHRNALLEHGLTDIHRRTFLKNIYPECAP